MNTTTYEIVINNANKATDIFTYEGKYKHKAGEHFIHIPISFEVQENTAYICVRDSDATQERIMNFSADEIRDSLRKVYLYHLLHFGKELIPTSIQLILNGKEYTYDNTTPSFPFMFSMISVPSDFNFITFDEELILKIIKESKTQQFKKDEYACLYAFLGGLGKEHFNDQFIYFWTAINSYYNLIAKEYNKQLAADLANDAAYQALRDEDKKTVYRHLALAGDEKNMHALALLYSVDESYTRAKPTKFKNFNPSAKSDPRSDENSIIVAMSTWFYEWNDSWDDMLHTLKNPDASDNHLINLKRQVFNSLRFRQLDAYAWVTFKFPYLFRCNSFHGSRAYLAFAGYNEPELKMVEGMCYAMRDFLNENVKKVFNKELLTTDDYNKIKFMSANYIPVPRDSQDVQDYIGAIHI